MFYDLIDIPDGIDHLGKLLQSHNYRLYIVGGYIRDAVINDCTEISTDIDICGDCLPEDFIRITESDELIDIKSSNFPLGTIKLFAGGTELEYTSFRYESYRGDGYHTPDKVGFTKDIYQDALRRDFTINAIYYDVNKRQIYDPFDGIADIKRGVLRCTRLSMDVFGEDALRLLRLCRFAGRTGFLPDDDTLAGANQMSHLIQNISRERIGQEMDKILMSRYIPSAAEVFFDTGINTYIAADVTMDDMLMLSNAKRCSVIRWAVFLHKMPVQKAKKYLVNLCLGKNFAKNVADILGSFAIVDLSENEIILHMAKLGRNATEDLVGVVSIVDNSHYDMLDAVLSKMAERGSFIDYNDVAVSGNDIEMLLNVSGKDIKYYKDLAYEYIVRNPHKNTYDDIAGYLLKRKNK